MIINGVRIEGGLTGKNITVGNGKIVIDGKEYSPSEESIEKFNGVQIIGNIEKLACDQSVDITGDVGSADVGGSVRIEGDVIRDVDAGGSIRINGDVDGNVNAGGSATITGCVKGDLDAGGSIAVL